MQKDAESYVVTLDRDHPLRYTRHTDTEETYVTKLTYSNASNAVRGFRQLFPAEAARLDNPTIRADFIDRNPDGSYSVNVEAVADYQQEIRGVVTGSLLVGVPPLRRSVSGSSTAKCRALFAGLPVGTSRRDALDLAVRSGIAFYTARTQYSRVTHG
jgi:hypothetical protein